MADLYIQNSSCSLSVREQRVLVRNEEQILLKEISFNLIDNILVFGNAQLSTQLLKALANRDIFVFYFSSKGEFLFSLDSFRKEDFEKQRSQARASFDSDFCLGIARKIAAAKIGNQLNLLQAFDENDLLDEEDFKRFGDALVNLEQARSIAEIMGIEGRLAKSYFYLLNLLVIDGFHFSGRSRRPALDKFNTLLNFSYSILYSCFMGLIRKNGLSLGFGVMHQPHDQHAVLASDLMEEWRPVIVDDTVLGLVNRQEILEEHFIEKEDGIFLTPEGIEIFSRAMRERILEIHHYVELDKNRYTFLYAADQQIKSLIRSFEALDPAEYVSSYTGGGKDGLL